MSMRLPLATLRSESVLHHKMLFNILYGKAFDCDLMSDAAALFALAEVLALAEYYQMLPAVARQIENYMQDSPGLWKAISEDPS